MSALLGDKLKAGRVAIGFNLQFPVAGIIESIGDDWDWIWIDGQHGQHDYRSILECVRVADSRRIAPVVRVPGHEPGATAARQVGSRPRERAGAARACPAARPRLVNRVEIDELCPRNARPRLHPRPPAP